MWFRIFILGALLYLLYRLLRPRRAPEDEGSERDRIEPPREDVMVQDPACMTYIPKSQALRVVRGSEELYFCSPECREQYLRDRPDH